MNLTTQQLKQALQVREKIDALELELDQILRQKSSGPSVKGKGMSLAGRSRVALAQKLRWAKLKGAQADVKAEVPVKKKRKMSAAAKKRMAEAAMKRWALAKAAGKNKL